MDKMKDNAPNFQLENDITPNNSPIGYPDMSGRNPMSYKMGMPPKRELVYHTGKLSHSVNSELKSMKLVK